MKRNIPDFWGSASLAGLSCKLTDAIESPRAILKWRYSIVEHIKQSIIDYFKDKFPTLYITFNSFGDIHIGYKKTLYRIFIHGLSERANGYKDFFRIFELNDPDLLDKLNDAFKYIITE